MKLCFEYCVTTIAKHRPKPRQPKVGQKHLNDFVSRVVNLVRASIAGRQPAISSHYFYCPSAIRPRHRVIWYLFCTDAECETAKGNGLISEIETLTRTALVMIQYPVKSAAQMTVGFTSEEDVQRQTGGDQRAYFRPARFTGVIKITAGKPGSPHIVSLVNRPAP